MQLQCTKCKYELDKDSVPKRCPYCGVEGAMQAKTTAQDILNEVADSE